MADKLASTYRFVTKGKDGQHVRVVLRPGDDVKDLPKDVRDDLKKRGLILDEKRLTSDGLRIPPGTEDREPEPESEPTPAAVPQGGPDTGSGEGDKDKK